MCLLFFSLKVHRKYKFVMAGNRDEFYQRETAPAAFWADHPDVLAGRDLEAMGTWLGVSREGKISMLTNYRDPRNIRPDAPSRGHLVSDYLSSGTTPEKYVGTISLQGKLYNGFNLLAGTADEMWYYSNYNGAPQRLSSGFYGLSNHLLDTPWPKVQKGKQKLEKYFTTEEPDIETIFTLLYDADIAPDNALPDTGLPLDRERALSSMFIKTNGYGSRCTSIILVDQNNHVFFAERVFNTDTFSFETRQFEFDIIPK